MPFLTVPDLYNRIYAEIVNEITRENENIALRAIDYAITEAKMYLHKFDLLYLFGNSNTEPAIKDTFLQNICIDLAVWALIKLGNPNIQYDNAKFDYEQAIKKLRDIQAGKAQPEGWPYKDTTGEAAAPGNSVTASSNPKRTNHF